MPLRCLALLVAVALLGACAEEQPPAQAPAPTPSVVVPEVDPGTDRPAVVALSLAPDDATAVALTDYDALRAELGADHPSASPAELARFRRAARAGAPLLTHRGLGRRDVAWEARFLDAHGDEVGRVLAVRDGTGVRTVVRGVVADVADSWATDPRLLELVDVPALATYVERGCLAPATDDPRVEELAGFAVAFEGGVATARLGAGRVDLFERLGLGEAAPRFARTFGDGVADPSTGRIGYRLPDPPAAAALALRRELPFAACAS